jgi:diguanylate cyclase (GGDEF)-like protein
MVSWSRVTIQYMKMAGSLAAFAVAYFLVPPGIYRQLLIYCLVPLGLVLSAPFPEIIVLVNGLGLVLLFAAPAAQGIPAAVGLALLLIATAFIPFYFDRRNRRLMEHFADGIDTLENETIGLQERSAGLKRKRQDLENEIDRINQLYVLGRELVEHMEPDEVAENVARVLAANPGIRSVSLFTRDTNGWQPLHISGDLERERWCSFVKQQQASLGDSAGYQVIEETPAWLGTDKVIFMPVRTGKDVLAALFLVIDKEYAAHYLEKASIFIPQIALGLKRTRLFQEVQERSRHDGLTGLFLRRHFLERLENEMQRAKRYRSGFALLLGDIDHFKHVNDTYGHLVGDRMLCAVAGCITDAIRPGDIAGRYGGEEFIVLMPLADPPEAARVAEAIRKSIEDRSFEIDSKVLRASISIGISHYRRDGTTVRDLLAAADSALYWVKNHGRNGVKDCREIRQDTKYRHHGHADAGA